MSIRGAEGDTQARVFLWPESSGASLARVLWPRFVVDPLWGRQIEVTAPGIVTGLEQMGVGKKERAAQLSETMEMTP